MDVYNQHAGLKFTVGFFENNVPSVPDTVHWRLDCLTTGKELATWTEVPVESSSDESGQLLYLARIDIAGDLNDIKSTINKREHKQLLVVCNKDAPSEFSRTHEYVITAVKGRLN